MELFVGLVETSIQVVDSVGGSFVGSSLDCVSEGSSLSRGRDTSNVEVVVGSRHQSSQDEGSGGGGQSGDSDVHPNSVGVDFVGKVP